MRASEVAPSAREGAHRRQALPTLVTRACEPPGPAPTEPGRESIDIGSGRDVADLDAKYHDVLDLVFFASKSPPKFQPALSKRQNGAV